MNQIGYEERKQTYAHALFRYGPEAQIMMAIEEMSELMKELSKRRRGRDNLAAIAEEIADTTIMLEQLRLIFDVNDAVCAQIDNKILRLQQRVGLMRFDYEEEENAE